MIYFIRDRTSRAVKIGLSENPWKRLSKMQSDSPNDLEIAAWIEGGADEEAAYHARFAHERIRGEWFHECSEMLTLLASMPTPQRPTRKQRTTWGDSGLSDTEVSRIVGACRPMISHIRRGERTPSLGLAVKISNATGVPLASMISKRAA